MGGFDALRMQVFFARLVCPWPEIPIPFSFPCYYHDMFWADAVLRQQYIRELHGWPKIGVTYYGIQSRKPNWQRLFFKTANDRGSFSLCPKPSLYAATCTRPFDRCCSCYREEDIARSCRPKLRQHSSCAAFFLF